MGRILNDHGLQETFKCIRCEIIAKWDFVFVVIGGRWENREENLDRIVISYVMIITIV